MKETRTFISHVAQDLLERFGTDLAHVTVVFPNKRAALFLNKELARQAGHAIWSPAYLTISDLFRSQSQWQVADPIKAVCDLYRVYTQITGSSESLDRFYGWGQLLLSDFDDIDKNMADADQVFRNITSLHELDDLSYLSEEQKELIARFFSNFSADDANSQLRQRFLKLWSRLADIYTAYRKCMADQQLAYEGMLYREVVERPVLNFPSDHYVFIGFNVLQQVEQTLFLRLQREGKATFYWNYDEYYVEQTGNALAEGGKGSAEGGRGAENAASGDRFHLENEAGVYIKQWLDRFPNALAHARANIYNNLTQEKAITFVSAPTEDIQARYVTTWLRENDRWKDGERTAIVLADESLLGTVVHCIPPEVKEVNITTGYPLVQTPITTLVTQLLAVQLRGYRKDSGAFRLHEVNGVLRHPYARMMYPEAETLQSKLNGEHRFFPKPSEVPFLQLPEGEQLTEQLTRWLIQCVESVGRSDLRPSDDPLFEESVFRMYTLLTRLHDLITSGDLVVDELTLQRLLSQIIRSTNIPYHGQPAIGVQVMGVLETRNLDFDHVLVLSCNEGNLPRGVDDASFIPHSLRKAFGLTTIDNKVAIFSYYFHSLLQRAKDVTLAYNTSPDGKGRGAMSRFMLQLLTELPLPIAQKALVADQHAITTRITAQEKTEAVAKKLETIERLSPSALITYLRCPKSYFYKYILGIREEDNIDEDTIDPRQFGQIFHRAAQLIYETLLPHDMIERDDIEQLLKRPDLINRVIDQAFNEELFQQKKNTTRTPQLNGAQLINHEVIGKFLRRLLRIDLTLTPFQVVAHEIEVKGAPIRVGNHDVHLWGRIDRLDRINIGQPDERLRVVDYKTGGGMAKDMPDVKAIFDPANFGNGHSHYILQAMAYSLIIAQHSPEYNPKGLPVSPALFFIQKAGTDEYDPTLTIGKEPITSVVKYADDFREELRACLGSIWNLDEPFVPTSVEDSCKYCPYHALCGEQR